MKKVWLMVLVVGLLPVLALAQAPYIPNIPRDTGIATVYGPSGANTYIQPSPGGAIFSNGADGPRTIIPNGNQVTIWDSKGQTTYTVIK